MAITKNGLRLVCSQPYPTHTHQHDEGIVVRVSKLKDSKESEYNYVLHLATASQRFMLYVSDDSDRMRAEIVYNQAVVQYMVMSGRLQERGLLRVFRYSIWTVSEIKTLIIWKCEVVDAPVDVVRVNPGSSMEERGALIDSQLTALSVEMERSQARQSFLTTWDRDSMRPPHTDVILRSRDFGEVHGHTAVLVGKSKVFKAMFLHKMEESSTRIVKMDMEHLALEAFVSFFYTGYVEADIMREHVFELLQAADMYELSLLKSDCVNALKSNIPAHLVFQTYLVGNRYNAEELTQAVIEYLSTHVADLSEVIGFDTFLREHPDILVNLCVAVVKEVKREKVGINVIDL